MRVLSISSILILVVINGFAQTDTLVINGFKFVTVIKTEKNEFHGNDTLMKLYRMENGKVKYLLTHYTHMFAADCNNEFTDKGTYKIENENMIFLTEFLQKTGMDPIPERRKQIYKVGEAGKLMLIYDRQQERSSNEWVQTKF